MSSRQQFWRLTAPSVRNGDLIGCKVDAIELTGFQRSGEPWPWAPSRSPPPPPCSSKPSLCIPESQEQDPSPGCPSRAPEHFKATTDSLRPHSLPHRLRLAETPDSEREQTSAGAQELLVRPALGSDRPHQTQERGPGLGRAGGQTPLCTARTTSPGHPGCPPENLGVLRSRNMTSQASSKPSWECSPPCTPDTRRPEFQARAVECSGVGRVLGAGTNTSLPTMWQMMAENLSFHLHKTRMGLSASPSQPNVRLCAPEASENSSGMRE
ncbi:hypothetical protein AAY473_027904 [Plecturocebus cupreus]